MDCLKIQTNINRIKSEIPSTCKLLIVSKYRTIQEIDCAYNSGHKLFAENRVQALVERKENLPSDIEWHMIGHLQRNKIKYISSFVHTIHSVDSLKLLVAIHKEAQKAERTINCMLQIHIAQEESKFGFTLTELNQFLEESDWRNLTHIQLTGLMAMATNTDSTDQIQAEFNLIQKTFLEVKANYFSGNPHFNQLSIGMSGDYKLALNSGSSIIRIGSGVFN